MARLLVVEDDVRLRAFLARTLEGEGHEVGVAGDGLQALDKARGERWDLVVLDLMLPRLDGLEVLAELLRRDAEQRVLVLSAVPDVSSRVRCLQMGAVDFLSKPFAAAELLARVQARLRAQLAPASPRWLRAGEVALDLERKSLDVEGREIALSHREFLLLGHLMRRSGQVCSRTELLGSVWGYSYDPGSNVVDVTVRRVRGKIPGHLIQTVRNVGYSFSAS